MYSTSAVCLFLGIMSCKCTVQPGGCFTHLYFRGNSGVCNKKRRCSTARWGSVKDNTLFLFFKKKEKKATEKQTQFESNNTKGDLKGKRRAAHRSPLTCLHRLFSGSIKFGCRARITEVFFTFFKACVHLGAGSHHVLTEGVGNLSILFLVGEVE